MFGRATYMPKGHSPHLVHLRVLPVLIDKLQAKAKYMTAERRGVCFDNG